MILTTQQLKQLLADYAKVPETEASAFVDALVQVLVEQLQQGASVDVQGLGTFEVVENQQGALKRVAFRPEAKLKEQVNAPFSFFEPICISSAKDEMQPMVNEEPKEEQKEAPKEELAAEQPIAPVEQPIAPAEQPEEPVETVESEAEEKSSGLIFSGIIVLLIVVLGGAVAWYFKALRPEVPPAEVPVVVVENDSLEQVIDSLTLSVDSMAQSIEAIEQQVVAQEQVEETPVVEKKPAVETPVVEKPAYEKPKPEQLMPDTMFVLRPGERLTLVAERVYGDKAFWGYIFEVNAYRLKNPNNVPAGVKYHLPSAEYYKIDATDEASLRRARQKSHDILKAYRE